MNSMSHQVVVAITDEGAEAVFISDDSINVSIFDLTSDDIYLHNENLCSVTAVNDDGTVNIRYLHLRKNAYNIPASEVNLYYCEDLDIDEELD